MALSQEVKLYLERARTALQQVSDNLNLEYFDVATSRAYYAMFYAASALLASKGIVRSKHSGVISAFGQYFVKPGLIEPQFSRALINAFNVRLDSDYEIQPSLNQVLAKDVLRDAQKFVGRATNYFQQEDIDER